MKSEISNYITRTKTTEWKPLIEEGVDTRGISIKVLRFDESEQRPPSFLLRFEPGAKYPYHNHPQGEEVMVLEGSCTIGGAELSSGDYLYTPPGYKHAVQSDEGCVILFVVPAEVEIIRDTENQPA